MPVSPVFAHEISATLVRLGISQREAAKRTRIPPQTLSNMCLGHLPSAGTLLRCCTALGIDPDPLLLAAGYPSAPFPQALPLLPSRVEEDGDHLLPACVPAPALYPIHPGFRAVTDFCLRITGDSMWPHLLAGDIVGIQARADADNGQLVAARLNGVMTLARWFDAGERRLVPDNPAYPQIIIDPAASFVIQGVVAWHLHDWLNAASLP